MIDHRSISEFCIAPNRTIRQAVEQLDRGGKGVVLVVAPDRRLIGTLTDGDFRRAILAATDFEQPVELLLTRKEEAYRLPWTAPVGAGRDEMIRLMREHVIRQLPLLEPDGRVVGLVTLADLVPDPDPIEAVIWSTAHSETNGQAGDHLRHALLPVGNKPLLELVVGQLQKSGIRNVTVAASSGDPSTVESALGDGQRLGVTLRYLNGNDLHQSVGTGPAADAPLLVIGANIITRVDFRALVQFHREHGADLTVAVRKQDADSAADLIEIEGTAVISLPANPPPTFADAGIYVLGRRARALLAERPASGIRSVMRRLLTSGGRIAGFPLREYWVTIGTLEDYQRVLADEKRGLLGDPAARSEPGVPAPAGDVPLCVPEIRGNEWAYIKECLDTNWVSSVGPFVDSFESMLSTYVGAKYGVATCNGTAALHTALLVAGVRPGDEVLVSGLTFIAPANAVRYAGAVPVFVDAEPDYWQMDPRQAAALLRERCRFDGDRLVNRVTGRRIGAIMPVHILGHPCDLDPLVETARAYGVPVIEDATESLGATYRDRSVGTLGDLACFSFNGNKLVTTGGGGMLVTDNEEWARRARYLTTQAKDDAVEYVHGAIGYNYRLTNVQAAMGCAQLEQIDNFLRAKRDIAERYRAALASVPGLTPMREADWARHAWWLYTVRIDPAKFGRDSRALMKYLATRGIQSRPLWQPLHQSPAHQDAVPPRLPVAEAIHSEALSLPCSVGLSDADFDRVVGGIREASRCR